MTEPTHPQRRAADKVVDPTLSDIWAVLMEIKGAHDGILSAFVLDDLGKPDYTGHRLAHKAQMADAEALQKYKTGLTKSLLDWAAKGLIVFLLVASLSSVTTYFREHLK
jgi:hypothetical protein